MWNERAVLASESTISFCALGMLEILKSEKQFWRVWMTSCSVEKFGQACGFFIIAIMSLQSVPKLWHVECCSMLSIVHLSASSSECNADSRLLKFRVPISWIFPILSFYTHPLPLNWVVEVHEPSTIQILRKLKICGPSTICACGGASIVSFALYQA